MLSITLVEMWGCCVPHLSRDAGMLSISLVERCGDVVYPIGSEMQGHYVTHCLRVARKLCISIPQYNRFTVYYVDLEMPEC
jgi:hypothetical protein